MNARALLVAAAACAAVAAPAAHAATNCFGPSTAFVCVTTPTARWTTITECVYAGGTTCKPVTVPWVTTSGTVDVSCGGALYCNDPLGQH